MPTGYTAEIHDGKDITFRDFALQCARAFGALVEIRDEPVGAPLPETFEPTTYHLDKREEAAGRLAEIKSMTDDDCRTAAEREWLDALADKRKRDADNSALRARYDAMLTEVLAWEPPTDEHVGIKTFMVEQIASSIRFDTGYERPDPVRLTPVEWRIAQQQQAHRDIAYHEEQHAKEVERATGRSRWLSDLRESLPEADASGKRGSAPGDSP